MFVHHILLVIVQLGSRLFFVFSLRFTLILLQLFDAKVGFGHMVAVHVVLFLGPALVFTDLPHRTLALPLKLLSIFPASHLIIASQVGRILTIPDALLLRLLFTFIHNSIALLLP